MVRQRLGQHFLSDRAAAYQIVAALNAAPARVIEIGPGRGALTRPLLERFDKVRAVEIDGVLADDLPARLGHPPGLEVVEADAVEVDLDEITAGGPWQVVGNLPYNVGTPIVRRLLYRHDRISVAVVMLQLEVVKRLLADAGDPDRGLLSVEAEMFAQRSLLFRVLPGSFSPRPRVESAVVRLDLRPPPGPPDRVRTALEFAGAAFLHRRKTLANGLSRVLAAPARDLAAAGIEPSLRPQALSAEQWLALAKVAAGGPL